MSDFLRRSLLYVPASSEKMLNKARTISSDAVILDLEDSVSPEEKEKARKNVVAYLHERQYEKEVIVRINALNTIWGLKDMMEIIPLSPDGIILPKANEKSVAAYEMIFFSLSGSEREKHTSLIPLLETAEGISDARQILSSSRLIDAIQLGAEDLARDLSVERTREGLEIEFARQSLVYIATGLKLDVLDTPYTAIHDIEGLRADCMKAKAMGFTGKVCIHPSHVDVINEIFSPSEAEISEAGKIISAYEDARKDGKGAVSYNGKMIDLPILQRAENLIARNNLIQNRR